MLLTCGVDAVATKCLLLLLFRATLVVLLAPSWHQAVRLLGSGRVASRARSKGSAQRLQHYSFMVATGGMVVDLLGACAPWRQQHAEEPGGPLAICLSLRRRLALLPLGTRLCGCWAVAVWQPARGARTQRKGYSTAASWLPLVVRWLTCLVLALRGGSNTQRSLVALLCHLPQPQTKARSSPSWHQAVWLLGSSRVASRARSKGSAQRLQHCSFEVATGVDVVGPFGALVGPFGACAPWRQQPAEEPGGSLAICLSLRRRLALLPLVIRLCGYWAVAVWQAVRGARAQRKGCSTAASRLPPVLMWLAPLVLALHGGSNTQRSLVALLPSASASDEGSLFSLSASGCAATGQ